MQAIAPPPFQAPVPAALQLRAKRLPGAGAAAIRRTADTHSLRPGTDGMVPGHTAAPDSTAADENWIEGRRGRERWGEKKRGHGRTFQTPWRPQEVSELHQIAALLILTLKTEMIKY